MAVADTDSRPAARLYHTMVSFPTSPATVLLCAGRESPSKPLRDLWLLSLTDAGDAAAGVQASWAALGSHPLLERWSHSAVSHPDPTACTMWLFGGRGVADSSVRNDVVRVHVTRAHGAVDFVCDAMPCAGAAPCPRFRHAAAVTGAAMVVHGGMGAACGSVSAAKPLSDCHVLDLETRTWSSVKLLGPAAAPVPVPPTRVSHRLVALPSADPQLQGRFVLAVGGVSTDTRRNSCLVLDLLGRTWFRVPSSDAYGAPNSSAFMMVSHTADVVGDDVVVVGGGACCMVFGSFHSPPATMPLAALWGWLLSVVHRDPRPNTLLVPHDLAPALVPPLRRSGWWDSSRRRAHTATGARACLPLTDAGAAGLAAWRHGAAALPAPLAALSTALSDHTTVVHCPDLPPSKPPTTHQRLCRALERFCRTHALPVAEVMEDVPTKVEMLGDVFMLPPDAMTDARWAVPGAAAAAAPDDSGASDHGSNVWRVAADAVGAARVARRAAIHPGLKRRSQVQLLLGSSGWVTVKENGLRYSFDVTKCMFSSGNVTEKARMARVAAAGETIVDLYAGIGYFTVPFLRHAGAAKVHAVDWNEDAVAALRVNLRQNNVADRAEVHFCDNTLVAGPLADCADRVCAGLIPSSEAGWPVAVAVLKPSGGWMHVHGNVPEGDQAQWGAAVAAAVRKLAHDAGKPFRDVCCRHVEVVKSYAPKVLHCVADVECMGARDAV